MKIIKKNWWIIPLIFIVITGFWIRCLPARFGELQALDPFYFLRMGEYVLSHNFQLPQRDMLRYSPYGVDPWLVEYPLPVYFPAVCYALLTGLGLKMHYLHFAILWPAVMGTLAVLFGFFVGRELFKSDFAGLFTSFFLAVTPAFITRTSAGFFEKEPLSAPFIMLTIYFFLKAYNSGGKKPWIYSSIAGFCFAAAGLTWGGVNFIYLMFGFFVFLLFVFNTVLVVLDYLVSKTDKYINEMEGFVGEKMLKAFGPMVIISAVIQNLHPRGMPLTSLPIVFCWSLTAVMAVRYLIIKFKLLEEEKIKYFFPAVFLVGFAFSVAGYMFSDYIYSLVNSAVAILTLGKSIVGTTVAENAPGNWNTVLGVLGSGFSHSFLSFLSPITPYFALWVFVLFGCFFLVYKFLKTRNWLLVFPLVFMGAAVYSVFYVVRMVFILGPAAALIGGFFAALIIEKGLKLAKGKDKKGNYITIVLVVFVFLMVIVKISNGYSYASGIGPSICFSPPCITIDDSGVYHYNMKQPWYQALRFLAENTSKDSVVLSWWDFGYWFQERGERTSVADGGNIGRVGGIDYGRTDFEIAKWYTSDPKNWTDFIPWLKFHKVTHILMDYTLPGKYGAISKIASEGEKITAFNRFDFKTTHQQENKTIYEFANGPYVIWVPFYSNGALAGTPVFLVSQSGKFYSKSYINDICTTSGIIRISDKEPSLPGCVSISDLGLYYVPKEAEHTIFNTLMFMDGYGLPVEKIFDNKLIKIYKVNYPENETVS